MSTATRQLNLVLVTPETTLLDEPVKSLRLPLYDGSIGILPGRAPVVGRLGAGELSITGDSGEKAFFVDGGFLQVKQGVVTVLTDRALPTAELSVTDAEEQLAEITARRPTTDEEFAEKDRDLQRTRAMLRLAKMK